MSRHKNIYTTGDIAAICKVAPRTVTKWFDRGLLSGYRIPGSRDRRITHASLMQFLKDNEFPLGGLSQDVVLHGPDHKALALADLIQEGMTVKAAETIFCLAKALDKTSQLVVLDYALLPADEREKTLKSVLEAAPRSDVIVLVPEDMTGVEDGKRISYLHHPVSMMQVHYKIKEIMARW